VLILLIFRSLFPLMQACFFSFFFSGPELATRQRLESVGGRLSGVVLNKDLASAVSAAGDTAESATNALKALAGRKFSDRTVVASYFSVENFDTFEHSSPTSSKISS
jgi:hypothetical protein